MVTQAFVGSGEQGKVWEVGDVVPGAEHRSLFSRKHCKTLFFEGMCKTLENIFEIVSGICKALHNIAFWRRTTREVSTCRQFGNLFALANLSEKVRPRDKPPSAPLTPNNDCIALHCNECSVIFWISLTHYPIIAPLRGSHGLSARRAWRTLSSRPKGPKAGPKGRNLEVGAQRAPRLQYVICMIISNVTNSMDTMD